MTMVRSEIEKEFKLPVTKVKLNNCHLVEWLTVDCADAPSASDMEASLGTPWGAFIPVWFILNAFPFKSERDPNQKTGALWVDGK